jgi:hypothetical protein
MDAVRRCHRSIAHGVRSPHSRIRKSTMADVLQPRKPRNIATSARTSGTIDTRNRPNGVLALELLLRRLNPLPLRI